MRDRGPGHVLVDVLPVGARVGRVADNGLREASHREDGVRIGVSRLGFGWAAQVGVRTCLVNLVADDYANSPFMAFLSQK